MDTGQDMEHVVERRQKPRQAVDRIAFIQMADGNSGTILDVSETGLRFRTVAPIAANGPVEFWYSMNLSDRVEARGEVVWRDATRKEGGLYFTNGAGKNEKKKKERTKTRTRKNQDGFNVLGAIPEMEIDLTSELAAVESANAASGAAEKNEEVNSVVTDIFDVEIGVPEVAVATEKIASPDEMTSKPEQRPKPQWKIELEEALAKRAAAKAATEAQSPREELQENSAAAEKVREAEGVVEPRISEPVISEPVAAQARPAPASAAQSPQEAPPQAPPQSPYKTPPIPDELFARIAARENERFYMPPSEAPTRSSWSFVKGIFAGMLATAAIVAFGFYYLGLQQERASGNVKPLPVEKSGTPDRAQDSSADKDSLQSSPNAAGVGPQSSAPTSAGATPGVAGTTSPTTPAATAPDARVNDPRALAQKKIPSPNINGAVAPNSAIATPVPAGTAQSQMAQRPATSSANPSTVNSAAVTPTNKVAQNGAMPGTAAKPTPYVKVPRTPEELWMDVAAGNTAAQIVLAQMYATGDGVGKNCEQARVLLKAAAAKGNAEAIRKYDDINETSCK